MNQIGHADLLELIELDNDKKHHFFIDTESKIENLSNEWEKPAYNKLEIERVKIVKYYRKDKNPSVLTGTEIKGSKNDIEYIKMSFDCQASDQT